MTNSETTACYLVGVAPRGRLASFTSQGLEPGQRAAVMPAGAVDAIVIDLPADFFAGDAAEARLADVGWLAPRAARHEAILREAGALGPVLPAGFGSVFLSTESIERWACAHADEIAAFFELAEGCDEWSLKFFGDKPRMLAEAEARMESSSGPSSGAAYLRRRTQPNRAEMLAREWAYEQIDALLDGLGATIREAVERRVPDTAAGGDWLISHIAVLVPRVDRAAFDGRLDALAPALERSGLRIELSGPWALYSFCPRLGGEE